MKWIELSLVLVVYLLVALYTGPLNTQRVTVEIQVPTLEKQESAFTDREIQCLARTIDAEARGEPLVGQLAVAAVILNRSVSPGYPKNICAVTTQLSQFASRNYSKKTLAIAQFAVDHVNYTFRLLPSRTMYFHSGAKTKTMFGHPFVMKIGHHSFYA
jgi:spore germination cell wall hydrolase CwlJ-like protein